MEKIFKHFEKGMDSVSAYVNHTKTRITVVVVDNTNDLDDAIYILPISVFHHVCVTRSFSSLVSFAKAHDGTSFSHIHNIYISNSVNRLSKKNLCSCPPETSPLGEVDGGILARHELLKESVPVYDCGSTFYRDDLGSCYDCFFPSDDRGE